jgi:hypothetical protein
LYAVGGHRIIEVGSMAFSSRNLGEHRVTSRGVHPVAEQTSAGNDLQQKYRQFLDLMPLTVALAGLPTSEGRLYSEEQIEARAITVRAAYRVARATAKDCLSGS